MKCNSLHNHDNINTITHRMLTMLPIATVLLLLLAGTSEQTPEATQPPTEHCLTDDGAVVGCSEGCPLGWPVGLTVPMVPSSINKQTTKPNNHFLVVNNDNLNRRVIMFRQAKETHTFNVISILFRIEKHLPQPTRKYIGLAIDLSENNTKITRQEMRTCWQICNQHKNIN